MELIARGHDGKFNRWVTLLDGDDTTRFCQQILLESIPADGPFRFR